MKQKIIPILVILAGFFLLSYPFVSNYLFEKSAGSTVESYQEKAAGMDQAIIKKVMDEAKQYNGELLQSSIQLTDPFKEKRLDGETVHYNRILNIDGSSIMGYLKIPCISVNLPIYHGTSGTVLEHGIGHLVTSSFPIGGKDTHAVLTGHTGLSSAKIFTDLTEMKKGHLKTIMYTNVHLFVCEFKFRRQWRNSGATTKSVLPGMSETLNYFAVEPQSKSYPSYGDIVNVMNNVVCLQGS